MRYREFLQLNELFDQDVDYEWLQQKDDVWSARAMVDTEDEIFLDVVIGKRTSTTNQAWEVEFFIDGSLEQTNDGNQWVIFATVLKIIEEFVQKMNPEKLMFSASKKSEKESRAKLYTKLVKRFARNFSVKTKDAGNTKLFLLTRKDL